MENWLRREPSGPDFDRADESLVSLGSQLVTDVRPWKAIDASGWP